MRSWRRLLRIGIVNLVGLLALLELAALVFHYGQNGELFYSRGRSAAEAVALEHPDGEATQTLALHPVFGFVRRPGTPAADIVTPSRLRRMGGESSDWQTVRANNLGFFSRDDYPVAASRTDGRDDYVIGIVGGSVAQWFALQGAKRLEVRLRAAGVGNGRDIRILNLAQAAFKQPQQLHVLSYLLGLGQHLDLVVNIDGFNEVALAALNVEDGVAFSLPTTQALLPLISLLDAPALSQAYLTALLDMKQSRLRSDELGQQLAGTRSAAVALVVLQLQSAAEVRYWHAAQSVEKLTSEQPPSDLVRLEPARPPGSEVALLARAADLWMRSSLLTDALLAGQGIAYVHALQPNQYYSHRKFGSDERAVAIQPASRWAGPAERGYPLLKKRMALLKERGVSVLDATAIFDEVREPIYTDPCCHYNQRGNEILADAIAAVIVGLPAIKREH